ncbi:MAG: glucose-6-phosphate isomerase [Planctomycetota bacterium]|nr:glucose-6-phosphate isomerase [Planctomycetota bacterium]
MDLIKLDLHIPFDVLLNAEASIVSATENAGKGDECWRMLWHDPMRTQHLEDTSAIVEALRPNCRNLLLIGIGGSALGAKALHSALAEKSDDVPNFYVLDNIDPHTVLGIIETIKEDDPSFEHTVVVVVSKSGETAEISALSMIINDTMQKATFVAITGKQGALSYIASINNWEILRIPEGVGGRFSVLSAVGLFPAAMCGININDLLDGAAFMDERCKQINNNPAADLATMLVAAMNNQRCVHIMMPYCDRLVQFAHWYVQLWSESLGKHNTKGERVGPTPITAIGVTDQHSMLQLWREGPEDKVVGFVNVKNANDVKLKTVLNDSQNWLQGHSLLSLRDAEMLATRTSLHDANQATWTLTLDTLDPHSIGQFIALWQDTVAIAGRLLDINPYDQSGVELVKKLTRNTLIND